MISLNLSYDEDDYVPALRMYLLRKPKFLAFFIFIYLLSIGLLMSVFDIGWFTVYSVLALLALVGLSLYALPHQRFRHSHMSVDEYWFHVTEHGIVYETEYDSGTLPWRRCTKLLEGKRFYLFEHDQRRITVIPKRVFKDKDEENAFRMILKSKLTPALSSKLSREEDVQPWRITYHRRKYRIGVSRQSREVLGAAPNNWLNRSGISSPFIR
jgi:hypothetical protein